MKDDITGEALIRRSDDNEETLRKRLEAFEASTNPVLDFYKKMGILTNIDATKDIAEVSSITYHMQCCLPQDIQGSNKETRTIVVCT